MNIKIQMIPLLPPNLKATKRHFTNSFFGPEELFTYGVVSNIMIDHYDIFYHQVLNYALPLVIDPVLYFIFHISLLMNKLF